MTRIKNLQSVTVNWERELYTVSKSTLAVADSHRTCWICGQPFEIDDGMWLANTNKGNKLMHTRCRQAQGGRYATQREKLLD